MRTLITVAAVLAMLACGQAHGQFTVNYILQLGGDNHATTYHGGGYVPYLPGSTADDAVEHDAGYVVYWAAAVSVTGPDDINAPAAGAANLVFNLELRKDAVDGPLVDIGFTSDPANVGGFYSTINDGSTDAVRTNKLLAAAFPTDFDVGGMGGNGGTLISAVADGGPNMDFSTYPSTFEFPTGSTAAKGTLVGMGAGYKQMSDAVNTNKPGVGIVPTENVFGCEMFGIKPLFEGQISTKGLATGTYFLVLTAGTGNNVIPTKTGDFPVCDPGVEGKFAVAATSVVGDVISFKIKGGELPPCPAPVLVAAQSVKTHGAAGDFGVDLMAKEVENRDGGLTKVVATFDKAVILDGVVTVSSGSVVSATAAGAVVTVELSGVPDKTQVTLAFPGVKAAAVPDVCSAGAPSTSTLCAVALRGDADNSATNDLADMLFIRDRLNQTANATNFRGDITIDGTLLLDDMLAVRDNLNKTVTVCP